MVTGVVMLGSDVPGASEPVPPGVIVQTCVVPSQPASEAAGIAKTMVAPVVLFAALIASRREQSASHVPSFVSAVLVTTKFVLVLVIVQVFTSPAASVIVPSA